VRVVWLLLTALALSIAVGTATWLKTGRVCSDTVPAYDGRCWGDRKLVVEGGVAICRCVERP
jgi:hypothetical protein